jgi:membrane-associated protease RseP (regulator of RpoE activity)
MPVYHYKAVDKSGRSLNGTMPASDEVVLGEKLLEVGLWLTDAGLQRSAPTRPNRSAAMRGYKLRGKNGRRELIEFSTLMTSDEGPADNAGIQEGDLIVEYNRTPVLGAQQLSRLVSETPLGRTVAVRYERNGQEQDVEVTVAETPAPTALRSFNADNLRYELNDVLNGVHVLEDYTVALGNHNVWIGGGAGTLGLRIQELTPELRTFFGTPGTSGLLVASVAEDSIGGEAGILVGDVITAIDGNMVDSAADIRSLANAVLGTGNAITVSVIRDGNSREIEVEPEE